MKENIIFHVDVNSAFLSWTAVNLLKEARSTEPTDVIDIRTIPSAIGGDQSKRHGIILAKSIPAKAYGIHTGEPVTDAMRKCPKLQLFDSDYKLYQKNSKAFMEILRSYSPTVEQYSIDEAFVDMTGMESLFGKPVDAAQRMKKQIKEELGFTVNVGISNNKLLAKMASDFEKPDRVHTLFPDEIQKKMWLLPVRDLFFVGHAAENTLKNLGIHTIGELAQSDPEIIKSHLKKHGETIWQFANGIDVSTVEKETAANKGYGNSTTVAFDVSDLSMARKVLLSLAETVGKRLRNHNVKIEVVSVEIKDFEFRKQSHQKILSKPTNTTNQIYEAACELFIELWDGTPLRLLGIQTSRVSDEDQPYQMSLFDLDEEQSKSSEKMKKLDEAVDNIRDRYGLDSIQRASFLKNDKVNHMAGRNKLE